MNSSQQQDYQMQTLRDLSGRKRAVRGVSQPVTLAELIEVVRWAQSQKLPLHAISCGKNWGFGSKLPEDDGVFVLDLSALRSIRQLREEEDWVELEPGVTQGMLDDALAISGRRHYFNVTGAGRQTSIIGNSLERGIGYFGSRVDDVLDLEVLFPDGTLSWTNSVPNNPSHTGLGPDLKSLFFQCNLGIVTAARFRLRRRPACMGLVLLTLLPGQTIARFVDKVGDLRCEGLFHSVPHIGNRQRLASTLGPVGSTSTLGIGMAVPKWMGVIPISGPEKVVRATFGEITSRLEHICECQFLCPDLEPVGIRFKNLVDLALGIPNDFALAGVANAALSEATEATLDLDSGQAGLIHVTPTCRMSGAELDRLLSLIDKARGICAFGEIPVTLNVVNSGMIAIIISVPFDRRLPDSQTRARRLADDLLSACGKSHFIPYRLGLDEASLLPAFAPAKSRFIQDIEQVFDPDQTLARSKYALFWEGVPTSRHVFASRPTLPSESPAAACV